jgi:hypothetical protein
MRGIAGILPVAVTTHRRTHTGADNLRKKPPSPHTHHPVETSGNSLMFTTLVNITIVRLKKDSWTQKSWQKVWASVSETEDAL